MRKRNYEKYYPTIARMVERNFNRLRDECVEKNTQRDDVFSETVLFIIHDHDALRYKEDEDFVSYFKRRFKMIEYQTIKDTNQLKEMKYADYIQARKETAEE